ncbi:hypothetical protein F5Y15DRAFT_427206 [Xylariaceae sp. FL0016]|nr:hypothetical protein F5Y15DRAFT_427206 [Xylariaceae sp. FL0016]
MDTRESTMRKPDTPPPPYGAFDNIELGPVIVHPENPPTYVLSHRRRVQAYLDKIIPGLGIPLAILIGGGITAASTWALVMRVTYLVANAKVPSDPEVWMRRARTEDYDPCYHGCGDCDDPGFAETACLRTAGFRANATVSCDGRRIWNWADRYPAACLEAGGEIHRARALEGLKQSYRNQYAIVVLTILAGVVGGLAVWAAWRRLTARRRRRARETEASWPGWRNPRSRPCARGEGRIKRVLVGGLTLCGARAHAYPCIRDGAAADAYFVNGNETISVRVHGWLSNCWDETICTPSCSLVCTATGGCTEYCVEDCFATTHTGKAPSEYVADVADRVLRCGLHRVPYAPADTHLRVANPGIEKNLWVTIGVNGYNVTTPEDTDPEILCLHDIGGH